jgi:hypothetical protein
MTDTTLFDLPIAHRSDPATSYEAGEKMIKSGELMKQQREVFEAIKRSQKDFGHNDFTARELSRWSGIDYFVIQRRLHELGGLIERTGEKREGCCVWRLR